MREGGVFAGHYGTFTEICGVKIFHRLGTHTKFDSSSGISVTATRG